MLLRGTLTFDTGTQAGELILDGFDNDEISEIVKCSIRAVGRWRNKLQDNNNLCSLIRQKGSGKPSRLNDEQKHPLKEIILKGAVAAGYSHERWTSKIISHLIQKTCRHDSRSAKCSQPASQTRSLLPNACRAIL